MAAAFASISLLGVAKAEVTTVAPDTAFAMQSDGRVVLVDVRTPSEWRRTGIPLGAQLLSLQSEDFEEKAAALLRGQPDMTLAFICRTGSRSRIAASKLAEYGLDHVINVEEGMMGQRNGEGWLARNLPMSAVE